MLRPIVCCLCLVLCVAHQILQAAAFPSPPPTIPVFTGTYPSSYCQVYRESSAQQVKLLKPQQHHERLKKYSLTSSTEDASKGAELEQDHIVASEHRSQSYLTTQISCPLTTWSSLRDSKGIQDPR